MKTLFVPLLFSERPLIDLDFRSEATPGNITISGGANGTRINSSGAVAATAAPRFDFDPVTLTCKGLLLEEARTNILVSSADFSTSWASDANRGSITANAAIAPDGTLSAGKLVAGSANFGYRFQFPAASELTQYQEDIYAKAGDASIAYLEVANTTGLTYFDLSSGTVTATAVGATASIEDAGNGWYRISAKSTTAAGATTALLNFGIADASGAQGCTSGKYAYFWQADVQAGALPTSAITTTASAVTRTADSVTGAFSATALAFVVEFDLNTVTGTRPILSLDDTSADNQIRLYASGADLKLTVTAGGVTQADLTLGTIAADTAYKAAFSCRANEFRAVMNGGSEQLDAAGTMPAVTTLRIGSDVAGNYQNGHNARTRGWTRRLSNLLRLV